MDRKQIDHWSILKAFFEEIQCHPQKGWRGEHTHPVDEWFYSQASKHQ